MRTQALDACELGAGLHDLGEPASTGGAPIAVGALLGVLRTRRAGVIQVGVGKEIYYNKIHGLKSSPRIIQEC